MWSNGSRSVIDLWIWDKVSYFLHYFTSKRLRIFPSPQFKKKKVTKTPERSRLEPKTIRSKIFGLPTWAICELTIAGGKKSIKPFRTGQPQTTCTSIAVLATERQDAFVSHYSSRRTSQLWATSLPGIRLLFPSASKIPAWLPYCYYYLRVQNFAILGFRWFCGY